MTVAVLCGLGERTELERLRPDLILDNTAQLGGHLPEHAPGDAPGTDAMPEQGSVLESVAASERNALD
jgi:hypothetical protein